MKTYRPITEFSHHGVPLTVILENHEKWIKQREGKKADLMEADLRNASLRGVYLRGADLIKADLGETDLREANLSEANLFGAKLSGAKIFGSNLRRANLERANLSEAVLSMCDFTEASLKTAFLSWTKMIRSNLSEANLSDAYMRGADMTHADLSKAVMRGAQMIGANLSEARMAGADLSEAVLTEAYLREADLSFASLRRADLREANLEKADLHSADLTNALLHSASLLAADLSGAYLNGACLDNAKLAGWIIKDVRCSHIVRGKNKEMIRFSEGEFEKKYGHSQNLCEIILKVPLTASGYYIGKFITRSLNHLKGSPVIELKGMEVLTEEDTKFTFNICDQKFYEKEKEAVEIGLRVALNKYFRDQAVDKDQTYFGDIVNEAPREREAGPLAAPLNPWAIDHRNMREKLVDHYNGLGKMGKAIYETIAGIFG